MQPSSRSSDCASSSLCRLTASRDPRISNLESGICNWSALSSAFHAKIPTLADRLRNILQIKAPFLFLSLFLLPRYMDDVGKNVRIESTVVSEVLDAPAVVVSSYWSGSGDYHGSLY